MVDVRQEDWEAAADYFAEADPADVFHGTELSERFARHREAADARTAAENGKIDMTVKRHTGGLAKGWTETPLFPLPEIKP